MAWHLRQKKLSSLTNMRNITKTDEGTIAWVKTANPFDKSAVQKRKITRIWEDADSYEFRYRISDWQIAETIARYDQPLNFWREIKIGAIRIVHLIFERLEFNFKN